MIPAQHGALEVSPFGKARAGRLFDAHRRPGAQADNALDDRPVGPDIVMGRRRRDDRSLRAGMFSGILSGLAPGAVIPGPNSIA